MKKTKNGSFYETPCIGLMTLNCFNFF